MSFVGNLLGDITGANQQASAAQSAAQTQAGSAQAGIDAQTAQFNKIVQLLSPYVNAGTGALTGQQDLLGLNGAGLQGSAISALENSPAYSSLVNQGETGILANASATGGLRGGNVQRALALFRPQILSQLIQQQLGNLGGIVSIGQNSAAGTGNAGMNTTNSIAGLLQQMGAATAGGQIAAGATGANGFNSLLKAGILSTALPNGTFSKIGNGIGSLGSSIGSFFGGGGAGTAAGTNALFSSGADAGIADAALLA